MKLMKRILGIILILVITAITVYKLGPKPKTFTKEALVSEETMAKAPSVNGLQNYVKSDLKSNKLKFNNQSRLYWADTSHRKTEYVILYLHGFSASPMEGDPVHRMIAQKYGMNLYVPCLAEHGLLEDNNMLNFTAEKYLQSAQEALVAAQKIGDKVIIMSTSTGSAVGLYLASEKQNEIEGLIRYSPNVKLCDSKASLLTGPWGIEISRIVKGGNNHT